MGALIFKPLRILLPRIRQVGLSNVVGIAAGYYHSLALRSDGTVVAWGANWSGQLNSPIGLSNVVAVAAGPYRSLALRADGTVVGWGNNDYGATNVPPGLTEVIAIATGRSHGLALRANGSVVAWGGGPTNVPAALRNVVAIASGLDHNLALRSDGTVVIWGSNSSGQTNVPAGLSNVVAIAANLFHNLALKANGKVVAWGANDHGQTNVPFGLTNVVGIAAGFAHCLALTETVPVPPEILHLGYPDELGLGGSAALRVFVLGAPPFNYQWQLNGTNIVGVQGPSYFVNNVQAEHAGEYRVVVSNLYGAVTSQVAMLTVSLSPVVFRQPQRQAGILRNGTVAFSVEAYGGQPLNFQWFRNALPLEGAVQPTLSLTNLQWSDAGSYSVVISPWPETAVFLK